VKVGCSAIYLVCSEAWSIVSVEAHDYVKYWVWCGSIFVVELDVFHCGLVNVESF
jgi:hypothetical protein